MSVEELRRELAEVEREIADIEQGVNRLEELRSLLEGFEELKKLMDEAEKDLRRTKVLFIAMNVATIGGLTTITIILHFLGLL
ncbi:MAG: hypothetical protein QXJ55_08875 [Candidatus Caldarchaeum sp.]